MGILRVDLEGAPAIVLPNPVAQLTERHISCEQLDLSSFRAELVRNEGPFRIPADPGAYVCLPTLGSNFKVR